MQVLEKDTLYRLSLEEQGQMFRVLASMLKASISLSDALQLMEQSEENARVSQVYFKTQLLLSQGRPLSKALAGSSSSFPEGLLTVVKIGEETGALAECLQTIAEDLERELASLRELKSTLLYPVVVAISALVSFAGLFAFLLPRLFNLLVALDADIPFALALALKSYQFIKSPLAIFFIGQSLVLLFLAWRRFSPRKEFQLNSGRLLSHLPVLGPLSNQYNAFRFASGLRTLISVGCPIVKSLQLLSGTLTNAYLAHLLNQVTKDIKHEGAALSEAMRSRGLFDPPFHHLLAAGEEGGKLEDVLASIAGFYRLKYEATSSMLVTLLEPAVLLVLGIAVVLLMLGFFLPLMNVVAKL